MSKGYGMPVNGGDRVSAWERSSIDGRSAAAVEEIREENTCRQSASDPYDHRRFVNFVVPDASEPYLTKS